MKITKSTLKHMIREAIEEQAKSSAELGAAFAKATSKPQKEGPDFSPATGEPITAKGREMEKKMVEQALEMESKCTDWAIAKARGGDKEMLAAILKHKKSGASGVLPAEIMETCPFKAPKEARRRLQKGRDRVNRRKKGLPPADDDTTQVAKIRRRVDRQRKGLPPAADDTSQVAKIRRNLKEADLYGGIDD